MGKPKPETSTQGAQCPWGQCQAILCKNWDQAQCYEQTEEAGRGC